MALTDIDPRFFVSESEMVFIPLIVSFGLPLNVFAIYILAKPKMRSPSAGYICGLLVTDIGILLFGLPIFTYQGLVIYHEQNSHPDMSYLTFRLIPRTFPTLLYFFEAFRFANIFCMVVISYERYHATTYGLPTFGSMKTSLVILTITFVISAVLAIPFGFAHSYKSCGEVSMEQECYTVSENTTKFAKDSYQSCDMKNTGTECYYITKTDFGKLFFKDHRFETSSYILPIIYVLSMNVVIAVKLIFRRLGTVRRPAGIFVILVIAFTFLICHTFATITIIAALVTSTDDVPIISLANLLIFVNSAIKFIFYTGGSQQFRKTMRQSFSYKARRVTRRESVPRFTDNSFSNTEV